MKIVRNGEVCGVTKKAEDIAIGTVFTGKIRDHENHVFFKAPCEYVVSLDKPTTTFIGHAVITNYKEQDAELHICDKSGGIMYDGDSASFFGDFKIGSIGPSE